MALVDQFVDALSKAKGRLYHFTDSRNVPSIQAYGLVPTRTINEHGVQVVTGGDAASLLIDRQKGLDAFNSLSFCRSHPMAHTARTEGRIETIRILTICPSVLLTPGVMFSDRVATANDAKIGVPDEMIPLMDLEARYQRLDWRSPDGQRRRNAAEKWEALVPSVILPALIVF